MASKVSVTGKGLASAKTNRYNDFLVDVTGSPSGKLSTEIEGPSRVDLNYIDNQNGTIKVSYKPSIPGDYTIHIKFNTYVVQGSPYRVHATGCAPISLMRHGDGYIRSGGTSTKPRTLSTSADFLWMNKPWIKLSLSGSGTGPTEFSRKSIIETV